MMVLADELVLLQRDPHIRLARTKEDSEDRPTHSTPQHPNAISKFDSVHQCWERPHANGGRGLASPQAQIGREMHGPLSKATKKRQL